MSRTTIAPKTLFHLYEVVDTEVMELAFLDPGQSNEQNDQPSKVQIWSQQLVVDQQELLVGVCIETMTNRQFVDSLLTGNCRVCQVGTAIVLSWVYCHEERSRYEQFARPIVSELTCLWKMHSAQMQFQVILLLDQNYVCSV